MSEGRRPTWNVGAGSDADARVQASAVGEIRPLEGSIELAEYDPAWPAWFRQEAARIRSALGVRAVMVEHVGSTSVPDLVAKPRIDILLIVPDSAVEASYVPDLEGAGHRLVIREPEWHEHRVLKGPDTDTNVHVFSPGCSEIERMVGFRDWLRSHDADRELYAAAKRDLAMRTWRWVQDYADAKTDVVEEIMARAGLPGPLADGGTR